MTETQEAFLVERGRAAKVVSAEAEPECVLVVAVVVESAGADSAKPSGEGLLFDCG